MIILLFTGSVSIKFSDGCIVLLHEPSIPVLFVHSGCDILGRVTLCGVHFPTPSNIRFNRDAANSVYLCSIQDALPVCISQHSIHVRGMDSLHFVLTY